MPSINHYPQDKLSSLWDRVGNELEQSTHMQEAAQNCVRTIYGEFGDSIVLARFFATLAFKQLPGQDQAFARRLADAQGVTPHLNEERILPPITTSRPSSGWAAVTSTARW